MSTPPLYKEVQPLDRNDHRQLKLQQSQGDQANAASLNSVFLAVTEFAEACREFPIVFVRTGSAEGGAKPVVMPIAVMGLKPEQNLFITDGKFTGKYAPAYLRRYPFIMVRAEENSDRMLVCMDPSWKGFSETEGEALFKEDGEPTELLVNVQKFLEAFEQEAERTREFCTRLDAAGLLQDMRFDATMGDGEKLSVDGFLTIDEAKFKELPEATVLEWHRNGMLGVLELHRLSLSNMANLAQMLATQAA